jgi:hypothetical protein
VKKTSTWLLSLTFGALALSAGGCGRAHLSNQYAQSYSAWFTAQRVKSKANPEDQRRIIESLDAGEAGAVSKGYRKGVGRGDDTSVSRLLTIGAPRAGANDMYIPPPSVP